MMKRRYLVFLVFFMFLYIGPVNFAPSYTPPAIVQRPQETKDFKTSTDISEVMDSDGNDDAWRWFSGSWDLHFDSAVEVQLFNSSDSDMAYVGQMRFEINVPKSAIVNSANLTFYEEDDRGDKGDMIVKRINEDNVGDLEADITKPIPSNVTRVIHPAWDGVDFEWSDPIDVTTLVQEQVNLVGWATGQFMAFEFTWALNWSSGIYDIEDFSATGSNHSYMNISYTEFEYDSLSVEISSDQDDDWWRWYDGSWDLHTTTDTVLQGYNWTTPIAYVGQMRFQLNLLKDATIGSANLTFYEVDDRGPTRKTIIKRINETNVGSLEADDTKPIPSNITTCEYDGWDSVDYEWSDPIDVTTLVQEQVNLPYWVSNNHIGFEFTYNTTWSSGVYKIEDYQNITSSNNAYLNITYTGGTAEAAYGANWLTGWSRRQQHNISQTDGTGQNYTVPLYVWNGEGGSWNDKGYTNTFAQDDFGDIRFTMNEGSTDLEYRIYETWESETTDYISNDSTDFASYPVNYPSAFYYNQRTYVTRHGPEHDPMITYYDHENKTWAGWYTIGDNSILWEADDAHGAPALFIDDGGYIHVFWGGHVSIQPIQHSVSSSPEDITSWDFVNEIIWSTGSHAYPHLYYDATNDLLHMYVRTSTGGTQRFIEYKNSTDKGVTWSNSWYILDMSDAAPYFCGGEMDSTNTTLSLAFKRYPYGQTDDTIYYVRANFTSKTVFNAAGESQGETVTDGELSDCLVYSPPTLGAWPPDVHLDENDEPYLIWSTSSTGGDSGTIMFTYWNGTGWNPRDNITDCKVWIAGHDFIVYDSSNITAFVSEGDSSISKNMSEYSWDGNTWTRVGAIVEGGSRFPCYSMVPMHHNTELQVTFGEYIPNDNNIQFWAYGVDGLLQKTWPKHALVYVRVQEDLSEIDATIYLYYGNSYVSTTQNATMTIDSGNDPNHGLWGIEEEVGGNNDPTNDQTPVCVNPDDTDNLYAKYRQYQITANVSDANGFSDLQYLEISLYSNDRGSLYWTVRFNEDTATFSEQSDTSNMISLNTTGSTNSSSGNTLNVTFHLTIHWNHTDLIDTDIKQSVRDEYPATNTDWYEVNYDVETRLDFTTGPTLNDGLGTVDRGDYNTLDGIVAGGTIDYYGSSISPDSGEVDVWVSCSDVEGGPWSDTTLTDGVFSVTVDSDNVVGLDTYSFIVVEKGEGVGGSDLSHTSHLDTYIADRLSIDIQADDETPYNGQQVTFTLTVLYDYDDSVCTTYTIVISRNAVWWHTFINGNKTLFNDTNNDVAYVYGTYRGSESTHGLTKYSSGSESVTWGGEATTTTTTITTTTTNGVSNYLEGFFLGTGIGGLIGPFALLIVGFALMVNKKYKPLGGLWIILELIVISQYFTLLESDVGYWWHIIILSLGVVLSIFQSLR